MTDDCAAPNKAAKILLINDDPGVLGVCHRILAAEGYQTTTAPSGDQGVGLLGQNFDVILCDLVMPGTIDGNEFTRRAINETQEYRDG